ncbi:uncharacterized protein BKA78DRAFT_293981 [Phyllosticta capitalensis]|uniref:uncharacterized protein n=1 Tax=Phyllosticta capitalensis TaxID=121624 RepID=UPI0031308A5A
MPGSHFILLHASGREWQTFCRENTPSIFLAPPIPEPATEQALTFHDRSIATRPNCMALQFSRMPTKRAVDSIVAHVRQLALLRDNAKITITEPRLNTDEWFQSDGVVRVTIIDKLLSPLMRAAITSKRGDQQEELQVKNLVRFNAHDGRITIIFFIRRSRDDAYFSTSLLRQLCTMLASIPEYLRSHGNMRVLILNELCSSSAHPMQDRQILRFVVDTEPVWVMTTNPDRLTRRKDEVIPLINCFEATSGGWLFSGIQDDNFQISDFVIIDATIAPIVEEQLETGRTEQHMLIPWANLFQGRRRALEVGFYSRMRTSIVRLLNEHQKDPNFPQLKRLRSALRLTFRTHEIEHILLCIKVSPSTNMHEGTFSTSLTRQQKFLEAIIPGDLPTTIIRGKGVSAYDGSFMASLQDTVQKLDKNTAILSASLDRMTRAADGPVQLSSFLKEIEQTTTHRHLAMSLLWDTKTSMPAPPNGPGGLYCQPCSRRMRNNRDCATPQCPNKAVVNQTLCLVPRRAARRTRGENA